MHQIRDYQQQAVDANRVHLYERGYAGTINHLATGLGKTVIATETVRQLMDLDKSRVMFVVHTTDLVYQAFNAFKRQIPELLKRAYTKYSRPGVGIVMGSRNDCDARIVIGTPQTLSGVEEDSNKRLDEVLKFGSFGLMIIDEAHYAASQSYLKLAFNLWQANPDCKRIGLTATPMRSDGMALRQPLNRKQPDSGNLFDTIAISRNIKWGIENGYLCPIQPPLLIQTEIDLPEGTATDIETRARMIDVQNWAELVVNSYKEYGQNRIGAYFLPSVEHSIQVAAEFNRQGVPAFHVDGEKTIDPSGATVMGKSERSNLYTALGEGQIKIACNYNVLTHGWDVPQIALVGLARPTDSPVLVTQLIGRGTRLHPSKSDLLVLDYALKNIPLCLSGSLLGYTWDEQKKEMLVDEEAEIEEISDGLDLRDARDSNTLISGTGTIVRVGTLFRKLSEAWYYDSIVNDSLSLSLSDTDILVCMLPNYTTANKISIGIENGEQFLEQNPGDVQAQEFFSNLQIAHEFFNNYTLWHLQKDESSNRWITPQGWVNSADSIELLFDYAAPLIARHGSDAIAKKNKTWRKTPPSEAQTTFLKRLGVQEIPTNKGDASQMISHHMALPRIRHIVQLIKKNAGKYG